MKTLTALDVALALETSIAFGGVLASDVADLIAILYRAGNGLVEVAEDRRYTYSADLGRGILAFAKKVEEAGKTRIKDERLIVETALAIYSSRRPMFDIEKAVRLALEELGRDFDIDSESAAYVRILAEVEKLVTDRGK